MNERAFFQQDSSAIVQANKTLTALQADLDTAYAHWAELDSLTKKVSVSFPTYHVGGK